jgi:hypothetical protein
MGGVYQKPSFSTPEKVGGHVQADLYYSQATTADQRMHIQSIVQTESCGKMCTIHTI